MRRQELHPRTAVINKSQKNLSKKFRHDALAWLAEKFPQAFDNSQRIRPLKTGIMEEILEYAEEASAAGISKSKLREAVVIFTRRLDYLACLKSREMRIDLEGQPVTAVTEDEAERAASKIKKRVEKSVRNARKSGLCKAAPTTPIKTEIHKPAYNYPNYSSSADYQYGHERPTHQHAAANPSANKSAEVIVKHKNARQYDPDAVARLKEKLGISKKTDKEEITG